MDPKTIVEHANRLIARLRELQTVHSQGYRYGLPSAVGLQAQAVDFLRSYSGPRSPFAKSAEAAEGADGYRATLVISVLEAFVDHVRAACPPVSRQNARGRPMSVLSFLAS